MSLLTIVVSEMVFQMVLVFGDKNAFWTEEQFLWLDVTSAVLPKLELSHGHKLALFAFKCLHLSLGVDPGHTNLNMYFLR